MIDVQATIEQFKKIPDQDIARALQNLLELKEAKSHGVTPAIYADIAKNVINHRIPILHDKAQNIDDGLRIISLTHEYSPDFDDTLETNKTYIDYVYSRMDSSKLIDWARDLLLKNLNQPNQYDKAYNYALKNISERIESADSTPETRHECIGGLCKSVKTGNMIGCDNALRGMTGIFIDTIITLNALEKFPVKQEHIMEQACSKFQNQLSKMNKAAQSLEEGNDRIARKSGRVNKKTLWYFLSRDIKTIKKQLTPSLLHLASLTEKTGSLDIQQEIEKLKATSIYKIPEALDAVKEATVPETYKAIAEPVIANTLSVYKEEGLTELTLKLIHNCSPDLDNALKTHKGFIDHAYSQLSPSKVVSWAFYLASLASENPNIYNKAYKNTLKKVSGRIETADTTTLLEWKDKDLVDTGKPIGHKKQINDMSKNLNHAIIVSNALSLYPVEQEGVLNKAKARLKEMFTDESKGQCHAYFTNEMVPVPLDSVQKIRKFLLPELHDQVLLNSNDNEIIYGTLKR